MLARWGVVEWIEHPLLMLEVRGSNPSLSILKKIPLLDPEVLELPEEPGTPPDL